MHLKYKARKRLSKTWTKWKRNKINIKVEIIENFRIK